MSCVTRRGEYTRAWFTLLHDKDDILEAIGYVMRFGEEAVLRGGKICVEVWIESKLQPSKDQLELPLHS